VYANKPFILYTKVLHPDLISCFI